MRSKFEPQPDRLNEIRRRRFANFRACQDLGQILGRGSVAKWRKRNALNRTIRLDPDSNRQRVGRPVGSAGLCLEIHAEARRYGVIGGRPSSKWYLMSLANCAQVGGAFAGDTVVSAVTGDTRRPANNAANAAEIIRRLTRNGFGLVMKGLKDFETTLLISFAGM
jgi:hypothetical protein